MTSEDKTRIFAGNRFVPGVRLNDTYQLDELIASGGMGQVFRGHNIETEEPVAIKTILSELADDDTIFALFKKEGLILGRLNHPTIVRYYAFSRDPKIGRPYLVMEYVEGESLAERMRSGPLPIEDVYQLFARVAEGLALAHKAGVVHRDLSPDNIIIQHGSVADPKVIDFGIAHAANSSSTLLGSSFAGKFSFVSPEQLGLADSQVTSRSDIYSLGLVMVAALRGKPLNMGTMPAEVIEKRRMVPDLSEIDQGIRPLIEQMLQPEAANRPESMAFIADWLGQAAGIAPKTSRLDTEPTAPWMPAAGGARFVAHVTPILPGRPAEPAGGMAKAAAPPNLPGSGPRRGSRLPLFGGLVATAGALVLAGYLTGWIGFGEPNGETPAGAGNGTPGLTPAQQTLDASPTEEPRASAEPDGSAPGTEPETAADSAASAPPTEPSNETTPDTTADQPLPQGGDGNAGDSPATQEADGTDASTPRPPPGSEAPPVIPVPSERPQTADTKDQPAPNPANGETVAETTVENPSDAREALTNAAQTAPDEPVTAQTDPDNPAVVPPAGTDQGAPEDGVDVALNSPPDEPSELQPGTPGPTPQVDPEDCYFAAIKTQSDDAVAIKGVGLSIEPFERIKSALAESGGGSMSMDSHLITAWQCPATAFLKTIHDTTSENPDLSFTAPGTRRGDKVAGVFNNVGSRLLRVFMVDGEGRIVDLQGETIVTNSPPLFNIPLGDGRAFAAPGLIVAIASAQPVDLGQARTAADLPALAEQLVSRGDVTGIDFGFFSYGTVLETVAQ